MWWSEPVARLFGWKRPARRKSDSGPSLEPPVLPFWSGGQKSSGLTAEFPRFRSNANDRIDPSESGVLARARTKFLQAFTPSQPVGDRRRFAGRLDLLGALIRAIEEKRLHVILYGARGLGKTSALHVLAQSARDARYLVVYLSCGANSTFDDVFRAVAANIPMLFYSAADVTSPEVEKGKTLADVLPKEPVSPRQASDMLSRIVGTRVVVLLDEFDRCELPQFRRDIAELIKNLSDRLVRVQLIIAGVATDLVDLLEHSPSIQRNIFPLQVPRMSAEEVLLLIRNGDEQSGVRFGGPAANIIVKAAQGSPYLASLLSHYAGLCALENERSDVTAADAMAGTTAAMLDFKGRLSARNALQLGDLVQRGYARALGELAGCAMLHGGSFSARDLSASAISADVTDACKELVSLLRSENLLFEDGQKSAPAYHFADDNITHYLWLLSLDTQLRAGRPVASDLEVDATTA